MTTTDETPLAGPGGLFAKIRTRVPTPQGQGQVFERLVKAFLTEDPLFAERFARVWHWSEWPGNRGERDTGIDLVAEERDGGVCAIQCKFYGPGQYLGRRDIDSFLVASARLPFTSRLFVATTERWSAEAEKVLADQHVPVQRIGIAELEASPFDWSRFDPDHPDQLPRRGRKELRPHQREAIQDVVAGFERSDRGKLVMACGTGKTFTALRLAEELVPPGGVVLYCVPSISLLSQSLRAWSADARRPLHAMAVCSDAQVTRDSEDIHVYDLSLPATTDPKQIAANLRLARARGQGEPDSLVVVFSTYQSLDRVADALERADLAFDLVIADEAHRTTGALAEGEERSGFTLVHDSRRIRAKRRLYMTATPRIYTERAKAKAAELSVEVYSMDDEALYGPVFHTLGFGKAVDAGLLSDYRVLVLLVDEAYANAVAHGPLADADLDLVLDDAARLVGCWRGLVKHGASEDDFAFDPGPMRRAVAFSTTIAASKRIEAAFPAVVEALVERGAAQGACETRHVDGSMGALVRDQRLAWLREDPPEGTVRVLTNARCLSEGVDVPALDAVLFLQPRKSQIDVVQAVGRVMRQAEGKRYGYVIIPVAVPAGKDPEAVLDDNERYRVVWQVLQALRAHDDRFDAEVNTLDLQRQRSGRIQVIGVGTDGEESADRLERQGTFDLNLSGLEHGLYARIVKHVGRPDYWEDWAKDVARIAQAHLTRIETAIRSPGPVREAFRRYLEGLRQNLNPAVSEEEAVEMLAQHLVTLPVFEALFGDEHFANENPVSRSMAEVLASLHEEEAIAQERAELAGFYASVRTRAEGIDNLEGRQRVVKELYETFFQRAFPKAADRLGIVYTPIEVVDFMLRSVDKVLRREFNRHLGADGVHVLDPFCGTGTFLARLLPMLSEDELQNAYRNLLHANELVLLAYYVAAVNIEQTYRALRPDSPYETFAGIVLTDTFQLGEGSGELLPEFLRPNSERAKRQQQLPITVVVGNPPYSVGQRSENDNNKNLSYPHLDERIRATYAANSRAGLLRNLYDSYIRAFRWASDRIGDQGIVCFVTNGAFIDAASADGFRKAMAQEFSAIYCLNLRGAIRGRAGDQAKREGGNPFDIMTGVAITLLVRKPGHVGTAQLYYYDIGDYLSREDKLARLRAFADVEGVDWQPITPNDAGDWINQRDALFETFTALGAKKSDEPAVFTTYSLGLLTGRDAWAYNFSLEDLCDNMASTIAFYEDQRAEFHLWHPLGASKQDVERFIDTDPTQISWTRALKGHLWRNTPAEFDESKIVEAMYRPFCKQWLYFDRQWNEDVYRMPSLFPSTDHRNVVIAVSGMRTRTEYALLATDVIPDLNLSTNPVQCFPRYYYVHAQGAPNLLEDSERGYVRHDAISEATLDAYRKHYQAEITADDLFYYVYGVLHSPEYRTRFAAELGKMLPRLPMAEDFWAFSTAGRRLAELHLHYERVEPWPLEGMPDPSTPDDLLRVEKMRWDGKKRGSRLTVNDYIRLDGIPEEAHRYELNGRTALEWIVDRYQVSTDKKSGIVNDPNEWLWAGPRYIVDLVAKIVRVSVETVEIVEALPKLGV